MAGRYNFEQIIDRRGKDALAVDMIPFPDVRVKEGFSRIPMWVADMNFAVLPDIQEKIIERVQHPTFGYFSPREEYFEAIRFWQNRRHGADPRKEEILFENSVLGGLCSAVTAFTEPGDAIFLHAPTYIGFLGTLEKFDRKLVFSGLKRDERGVWRMDYADMEQKIAENRVKMAVFCSPHNPCGRVWEREEVETAMEIFRKHGCLVVSDEIWSDLILPGHRHIPTQSVSEDAKQRTIALYAPSKTFSLAGLTGAYSIIYNQELREKMEKTAARTGYNHLHLLSMYALIGAYSENGLEWVRELMDVLEGHVEKTLAFFAKTAPEIRIAKPEGTYMLYLDCAGWCEKHGMPIRSLQEKGVEAGVIWQNGEPFGMPGTIRMNLALPESLLDEALDRLAKYVFV